MADDFISAEVYITLNLEISMQKITTRDCNNMKLIYPSSGKMFLNA